jgi:hypothetical protein
MWKPLDPYVFIVWNDLIFHYKTFRGIGGGGGVTVGSADRLLQWSDWKTIHTRPSTRPIRKTAPVGSVVMREVEDIRLSAQVNSTLIIHIPGKVSVPDHDGGRPEEVNTCVLNSYMVYV